MQKYFVIQKYIVLLHTENSPQGYAKRIKPTPWY